MTVRHAEGEKKAVCAGQMKVSRRRGLCEGPVRGSQTVRHGQQIDLIRTHCVPMHLLSAPRGTGEKLRRQTDGEGEGEGIRSMLCSLHCVSDRHVPAQRRWLILTSPARWKTTSHCSFKHTHTHPSTDLP